MDNKKSFWTDSNIYPKRSNIFLVEFNFIIGNKAKQKDIDILGGMSGIQIEAKSVNLPSFSFSQSEKSRNTAGGDNVEVVPGILDWTPITLTFADLQYRNTAGADFSSLYESMLYAFSRVLGTAQEHGAAAFSPSRFRRFFKNISITSVDDRGRPLDMWTLKAPWPVEFKSPELNYENDAIREFSLTLDYVIAEYTAYRPDGSDKFKIFTSNSRFINQKTIQDFPGG